MLLGRQLLVMEMEDQLIGEGPLDVGERGIAERGEIDTIDIGAERARHGAELEMAVRLMLCHDFGL